jgi:hypothetical protein
MEAGDCMSFNRLHAVYTPEDSLVYTSGTIFTSTLDVVAAVHKFSWEVSKDDFFQYLEELIFISSSKILSDVYMLIYSGVEFEKTKEILEAAIYILKHTTVKMNLDLSPAIYTAYMISRITPLPFFMVSSFSSL